VRYDLEAPAERASLRESVSGKASDSAVSNTSAPRWEILSAASKEMDDLELRCEGSSNDQAR